MSKMEHGTAQSMISDLETVGQIEICVRDIDRMQQQLKAVPLWGPSTVLVKQASEAKRLIGDMKARLGGHLVVTLVGPSGAGKSTLFNALADQDDLSPVGVTRPTTQNLMVLTSSAHAARQALGELADDQLAVLEDAPDHLIFVDTPDTDSTHSPQHIPLLQHVVERSDVLVCVFDAQNPHRRDHADFMAPLVKRFNGASLVAVVNKCDRLSAQELTEVIGPAIEGYLKHAWEHQPEAVLLVSARNNLKTPQWDAQAKPRHHLDQFDLLKELILKRFNQPGAGHDRRVANAGQLRDYVATQIRTAANRHLDVFTQAQASIHAAERQALTHALGMLRSEDQRQVLGVQVRLYHALAQRWIGPVGWLVAIWSRLIVLGSGLTALVRFGNPLRQIWGLLTSWRRYKESQSAVALLNDPTQVSEALHTFRKTLFIQWPEIAEPLVDAGFDPSVRQLDTSGEAQVGRSLETLWTAALDRHIQKAAKTLSHSALQLLFNLPGVALMGYVGWLTATRFFSRQYLTTDFFMHAMLTIVLVLLLSFFLFQGVVRMTASRRRIQRRAFAEVEKKAGEQPVHATRKVLAQVARVVAMAENSK